MRGLRPTDLAREHGISTQAVRNYEQDGFLPGAERTAGGYRIYTEMHAAALRAYLSLVPAHGHAAAGELMRAIHRQDLSEVLLIIDLSHDRLLRDRQTLDAVRGALSNLPDLAPAPASLTIGDLARRLGLTAATVRNWERAGILTPARDPATGYRVYDGADVRDADLTHLLRRGGYPLDHIATVIEQVRSAGGTGALSAALADWQRRLTGRGLALLTAAARLDDYLRAAGVLAPHEQREEGRDRRGSQRRPAHHR